MDLGLWLTFFIASWAISLSPGPGAVAAMSAGLQHGFRRGYWLSFGLILGIWTLVLVVGAGLGALLATSSLVFAAIKWLGVAYLMFLGVQQWRAPPHPLLAERAGGGATATRCELVLRGWMINAVNPKGAAFMLAVVPQFLELTRPLPMQYLVIALTLALTDLVVMASYTALASRVQHLLRTPAQMRTVNKVFGAIFVAAGVLLAGFKRGV